jgi:hypothetical protein
MSRNLRPRLLGRATALACGAALVATTLTAPTAVGTEPLPELIRDANQEAIVLEVVLPDVSELDRLVETGADLDHHVHPNADGSITAHVVATASEQAALKARGFVFADTVHEQEDTAEILAEREATLSAARAENTAFAAEVAAAEVSDVKIIRADYYTSFGQGFLNVEAKFANGQTVSTAMQVQRDSGPGTEMGSGGSQNISRFVDGGVYLYHRGAAAVATRPDTIQVTSPTGDVATAKVTDWLPIEGDEVWGPNYQKDFINSYLTPTELYERIHALAEEFPQISEIVELPYQTNGYRRNAQAIIDPTPARLTVSGPSSAAGTYTFAAATYGPAVSGAGLNGNLVVVNDGSAAPAEGCAPLVGFPAGAIALVDRGNCNFADKTLNAQAAGASAVVIVNNTGGAATAPGGTAPGATIPTVMISQADGATVKSGLPATGTLLPASGPVNNAARVGIDSKAWGHEGGNDITVRTVNPGVADSPLSVSVSGNDITISLATNASGALSSTAAQVRDAINANPAASAMVFAYTYRNNAGNGIVPVTERIRLTDGLSAPESVSRDPQTVYALRIGKDRDGSKMGVLAYAQEHAREWVPPLVTIETAERLLRNYQHDGKTKQLVNNLDIWILPSVNPDGGHYSFYDFASQRKNMTRHCAPTGNYDFLARNAWGVDNNRNYDEYSLFDGYSGASTSCTGETYAGPAELSEPESANVDWVAKTNPNIKFAMNLHSSGNYFMWSPGAYSMPGRISAPRPTLEQEGFFWGSSSRILTEIKRHRGMSVTPARTGPISDVLYSAAGNSGDMLWYKYGIYAWNFEVGTQFQPPFSNENPNGASAHQESQEFANGLVELMRVAHDFDKDKQRPESSVRTTPSATPGHVDITFDTTEPASVFYTLDKSTPTYESTLYAAAGIREGAETITVPAGTTIHFFSVDAAGNVEKNYRPDGNGRNFNKVTVR